MQERLKNLVKSLHTVLPYSSEDALLTYISASWEEISSRGQEYRLYNIIQALGTITEQKNIQDLVEGIVSGSEEMWAIAENYCYDYFVLNDMLLL